MRWIPYLITGCVNPEFGARLPAPPRGLRGRKSVIEYGIERTPTRTTEEAMEKAQKQLARIIREMREKCDIDTDAVPELIALAMPFTDRLDQHAQELVIVFKEPA